MFKTSVGLVITTFPLCPERSKFALSSSGPHTGTAFIVFKYSLEIELDFVFGLLESLTLDEEDDGLVPALSLDFTARYKVTSIGGSDAQPGCKLNFKSKWPTRKDFGRVISKICSFLEFLENITES